jgi:hypothetical protein
MARDPDDDALSWGDDGDPTYLDSPAVDHAAQRANAESQVDVEGPGSPTSTTPSESTAPRATRPSLSERRARAAAATSTTSTDNTSSTNTTSSADTTPSADNTPSTDTSTDTTADGDMDVDADLAAPDEPQGLSSVMLLTLGVLGGVYLLYTIGWFTSASRTIAVPIGALDAVMAHVREYLSIAAPALWFGATLLLTRGRKSSVRVGMLLLGAIVLLPLPFALGV